MTSVDTLHIALASRCMETMSTDSMVSLSEFLTRQPELATWFRQGKLILMSCSVSDSWILVTPSTHRDDALVSLKNMAPG